MDRVSAWGYAMGLHRRQHHPLCAGHHPPVRHGHGEPGGLQTGHPAHLRVVAGVQHPVPEKRPPDPLCGGEKGPVPLHLPNLWATAKDIFTQKRVFFFIIAYFFYIDGVNTIISISTSYGHHPGLDTVGMILALLVHPDRGHCLSPSLFGKLAGEGGLHQPAVRVGGHLLRHHRGGLLIWASTSSRTPAASPPLMLSQVLFLLVHGLSGGHGAGGHPGPLPQLFRQAHPRRPLPTNTYGFFDIFGKFAAVIGPLLVALFTQFTGRDSIGVISLAILFLIGGGHPAGRAEDPVPHGGKNRNRKPDKGPLRCAAAPSFCADHTFYGSGTAPSRR